MSVLIWGILAGIFLMLELLIPKLISIFFAVSSFIMMFMAFVIKDIKIQLIIFVIILVTFMMFVRKNIYKRLKNSKEKFNAEMKGEAVIILKKISSNKYKINYKGVELEAISKEKFNVNEVAKILDYDNRIIIGK